MRIIYIEKLFSKFGCNFLTNNKNRPNWLCGNYTILLLVPTIIQRAKVKNMCTKIFRDNYKTEWLVWIYTYWVQMYVTAEGGVPPQIVYLFTKDH